MKLTTRIFPSLLAAVAVTTSLVLTTSPGVLAEELEIDVAVENDDAGDNGVAEETQERVSVLDVIRNSDNHSILRSAISSAAPSIGGLLSDESVDLTVFAPDNDAFGRLNEGTLDFLSSDPWVSHLTCVLAGHIVFGTVLSTDDVTDETALVLNSDWSGFDVTVSPTSTAGTISVNGIVVSNPDILASNGIVHSITDGVLLPSCVTDSVLDRLEDSGEFSILIDLLSRTGIDDILSNAATEFGLSVFAPTDEAFNDISPEILASLQEADNMDTLTSILNYHLVDGNVYANANNDIELRTFESSEVVLVSDDGVAYIGTNDESSAIRNTLLASNGVIHVINNVRIPPTVTLPGTAVDIGGNDDESQFEDDDRNVIGDEDDDRNGDDDDELEEFINRNDNGNDDDQEFGDGNDDEEDSKEEEFDDNQNDDEEFNDGADDDEKFNDGADDDEEFNDGADDDEEFNDGADDDESLKVDDFDSGDDEFNDFDDIIDPTTSTFTDDAATASSRDDAAFTDDGIAPQEFTDDNMDGVNRDIDDMAVSTDGTDDAAFADDATIVDNMDPITDDADDNDDFTTDNDHPIVDDTSALLPTEAPISVQDTIDSAASEGIISAGLSCTVGTAATIASMVLSYAML